METHQKPSHAAIVGYSTVSHMIMINHMQATWRESDWRVNIQKQAPESAQCVPDPFLLLGVGSGNKTNSRAAAISFVELYVQLLFEGGY